MTKKLPSFDRPPVIEVVMGIQFRSLDQLLSPHIGKFWTTVEADYPRCSDNPPIIPQIENFERPGAVHSVGVALRTKPDLPRVFLEDASGHWLVQIQRDRFLHNWRVADDSKYPRYEEVKRRFFQSWGRFEQFLRQNQLGGIDVTQLEITYLNRISLESSRISDVFPDFAWRDRGRYLSRPESMDVSCSFKSSEGTPKPKRLRVNIKTIIQNDGPWINVELTVRGGLLDSEQLENWFDEGRSWIVNAFADLTSEEWHLKWGRTK